MSEQILEHLDKIITEFTESQSDVQGQIVVCYPEGVPIANTWKGEIDPILVGALSAAVKLTFQNLCKNLKKGNLKRLLVNNENGRVIIQNAGPKAILTTIIEEESDFFRIAFQMSNIAIKIEKLLKKFDYDEHFEEQKMRDA
jgi:predicted regulator of Ras-like GTPase activity (Roadblock/LC7/MglB family)